jgi:hypothetical protein
VVVSFSFCFSLSYFVFVCDRAPNLRGLTMMTSGTGVFRHFPKIFRAPPKSILALLSASSRHCEPQR